MTRRVSIFIGTDGATADDQALPGTPVVGRGVTVAEALGRWCYAHRASLGLEIELVTENGSYLAPDPKGGR